MQECNISIQFSVKELAMLSPNNEVVWDNNEFLRDINDDLHIHTFSGRLCGNGFSIVSI